MSYGWTGKVGGDFARFVQDGVTLCGFRCGLKAKVESEKCLVCFVKVRKWLTSLGVRYGVDL